MASLPLTPSDCAVVLVDYQAGLAFAAGSADRVVDTDEKELLTPLEK